MSPIIETRPADSRRVGQHWANLGELAVLHGSVTECLEHFGGAGVAGAAAVVDVGGHGDLFVAELVRSRAGLCSNRSCLTAYPPTPETTERAIFARHGCQSLDAGTDGGVDGGVDPNADGGIDGGMAPVCRTTMDCAAGQCINGLCQ